MTMHAIPPGDPELKGITAALRRAQEKARRLAEQTGTPFIVRTSHSAAQAQSGKTGQRTVDLR
jgi:hypothetical protein